MNVLELINKSTRPFSMYKGMLLGLIGIWLSALVLAFVGLLDLSPLAMLLSLGVLAISVYGTSLLCGLLFGIRIFGESSFITAFILSFLFFPADDVPGLVVLAFVGMIAGASKFILTWRGRHIFNPAALAAVVIGFTGLGAATWWVATPILTPIVLAVVLVSLYQSKRFDVVGIFFAFALPIFLIQAFMFGADLGESLWMVLSWPLLFLAGIMLTEPLTLPPRKWQMYSVAAIVGALAVLPLELGFLSMTPALALLVGNIVALILGRRRAITLTFKKRNKLTPTTDELVFSTDSPFKHEPGQYVELYIPHKKTDFRGTRRRFSITSVPGAKEVTFGIKFYEPSSSLKKTLRSLAPGETFSASQLAGDFVLPKDETKLLLFIAGGIGVTPFISHLRWLEANSESRDITMVYAVSRPEEIAYTSVLEKSGAKVIIVSPTRPEGMPKQWHYSEGSRIDMGVVAEFVPDLSDRYAYVSGPIPFVQTTKHALKKQGVQRVTTDYFAGY